MSLNITSASTTTFSERLLRAHEASLPIDCTRILAAFASDSWGQSKQPSSKATQQKSNEQDRGTESSPVVVKVMPTEKPKDELEAEKTKQESDRQLVKLTGDLANYTQFLFGATAALVIAAAGLVILGFYQSRDTKRSIKAAEDSARIAARALTELERPFVGIEITSVGFSVKDPKSDPYVMLEGRPQVQIRELWSNASNNYRTLRRISRMRTWQDARSA